MKPLARLEALIAEIVERPAWGLSARRVHPLDLTTALLKAMESRAIRLADRILAPDGYQLRLNPADLDAFADVQSLLERELGDFLLRTYEERDLSCNLPPTVKLLADSSVRLGKVEVSARFSPLPEQPDRTIVRELRPVAPPRPAEAGTAVLRRQPDRRAVGARPVSGPARVELIGSDGAVVRSCAVPQGGLTIGRRSGADVALLDIGVSREHARVENAGGRYAIVDLNSTNGTFVNGEQVRGRRELRHGDVISVGRFQLRFVQAGA